MGSPLEVRNSAGHEKYHPHSMYEPSNGTSDEDESGITLLGDRWKKAPNGQRKKCRSIFYPLLGLFVIFCISSLAYLSATVHTLRKAFHLRPTGIELGDCGSSHTVEEARAKGCLFDPMSWLWVRPECYDQALIDDFMNRTDWSWHTDWKLTPESQVPLKEVFDGDHPQLFTGKKYHSIHCTYMWQKMHKALLEHRPVDTDLTSWHHTHHCEEVLLDQYLHEDSKCTADMVCPTLVRATWTSCGYFWTVAAINSSQESFSNRVSSNSCAKKFILKWFDGLRIMHWSVRDRQLELASWN